ncbi:MAG TPA: DUF6220 domain-containing protein [Candidatus Limnocylindrales bacterium]|nr:DUF6220 domain-containing protein [Candidatus Limnocylindrales bacterium]
MQALRYVFVAAAAIFVAGVVTQVFLAGMAVFGAGAWENHVEFGYLVASFPVLLIPLAVLSRAGRGTAWLTVTALIVAQVQTFLPWFREDVPWIAALHPVNAMVVFGLAVIIARRSLDLARGPAPAPSSAQSAAPAGLNR